MVNIKDKLCLCFIMKKHVNPKIFPIADRIFTVQIFNLIELANEYKQLKKGANESIKSLNRGLSELIILAADAEPIEIILHLPLICEDKNIPYIFVNNKYALGKACGLHRPVVACSLMPGINLKLNQQIKKIQDQIENSLI
nr:SNU13 snRNP subunit [Cryptomonas paramecium]